MPIKKRLLGRTGLEVTEIGLGGYWFKDRSVIPEVTNLVRRALDLGVNLVDTAPGYKDSEIIMGEALEAAGRNRVILSTKYYPYDGEDKLNLRGSDCIATVEESLKRLKTDHLDILHLHWVHSAEDIERVPGSDLGDTLQRLKKEGKILHLAVSEASELDGEHKMLLKTLPTRFFESIMVTYNILLQTADPKVLELARDTNTGVLVMMALNQPTGGRSGLISRECAMENIRHLIDEKALPETPTYLNPNLFDFLVEGSNRSMAQSALRFVLDHPAVSSVMVGTSSAKHLDENIGVSYLDPLPRPIHLRARELFGTINKHVK
jgi:aryl-alcohol dehydrogenase-like predicted oxidoreductase